MMNPFTAHTQQQGVTYFEHWLFAMGIAHHLLVSVVAFALHALLPFIPIAPRHDLEATTAYLVERNQWIESAKTLSTTMGKQNSASSGRSRFDDILQSHNERRIIYIAAEQN